MSDEASQSSIYTLTSASYRVVSQERWNSLVEEVLALRKFRDEIEPRFNYKIITSLEIYQEHMQRAISEGMIHDITDHQYSELGIAESLPESDYIHIVQKSPSWLALRSRAAGTGSSLGKYLPSRAYYPSRDEIVNTWRQKIEKTEPPKTVTMEAHMAWGVEHENAALLDFTQEKNVSVTKVGVIKVPFGYLSQLLQERLQTSYPFLVTKDDFHLYLLISPDGIVRQKESAQNEDPIGMLEIKCISPFHHLPSEDGGVTWVKNLEKRQWRTFGQIPFVYVIQIALQALAGRFFYKITDDATMYFTRWSPKGYALFEFPFSTLIDLGLYASMLYLSLLKKVEANPEKLDSLLTLMPEEESIYHKMLETYDQLGRQMVRNYYSKDYSSFYTYFNQSKHQTFYFPGYRRKFNLVLSTVDHVSSSPEKEKRSRNGRIQKGVCLLD